MRGHVGVRRVAGAIVVSAALLHGVAAEAQAGRWSVVEVPSGAAPSGGPVAGGIPLGAVRFDFFVPRGAILAAGAAVGGGAPAVVFLHAAGRRPDTYRAALMSAADSLGVALILPHAPTGLGWGFDGDFQAIEASIARAAELVPLDASKIALAGHGEGGGYAYLLTYLTELRVSAVLTLGAPFLPVSELFDPERAPPIRMVFGDEDPTYRRDGGLLREQWSTLGVEWQLEVLRGYGHSTWPERTIGEGLRFLAERTAALNDRGCRRDLAALCLGDGRFRVEVTFADLLGRPGRGRVVGEGTDDSGIFWFFDSGNWEAMVKVLDGCAVNDRFWVFAAAPTDLDYRVTVTDHATGEAVQYRHEAGVPSSAVTDTEAFATCGRGP
ncbi:MAG TPA: hypothetical protein VMV46_10150 [Thermoanaerobaculia bacterium]|nr:hypothetical protein [Thermoanaerobaculia bacterium]